MEVELTGQEKMAQEVSDRYADAEKALVRLSTSLRSYIGQYPVGRVTRNAIISTVEGALGMVAQSHLLASKFDPRPQTEDDGGGK